MNIWESKESNTYGQGKAETTFTKWRVLAMDRIAELTGLGQDDAAMRLHNRTLRQLGLDYDSGMTAEELAQELAR
jgi:hypothetical protein